MGSSGAVMTSTILFLVINVLATMFSGVLGVSSIGGVVTNALFNEDNINTANPELNQELEDGINTEMVSGATDISFLSFVDGLKQIFKFIVNLLLIGFAIMTMLYLTQAPIQIVFLIGLPVTIGFYVSIASFIRGFSG